MIDPVSARTFVEANGTPVDRLRLRALLDGVRPQSTPSELQALQNEDGGVALFMNAGLPSALSPTAYALAWLRELGLDRGVEARRALRFLAERQSNRGIWRERPELQAYDPPPWMDPKSTAADVYNTALCASTLAVFDEDELAVELAVAWLQSQQGRDGLLAGFRAHSSWIALPAFVSTLGNETRATRRLVGGLGQLLRADWTGAMLAWMLRSLLDAGYGLGTPVVARAWAQLQAAQQPDGSFGAEEGEEPAATVLQALAVAGKLAP